MTIQILSATENPEFANAERLKQLLLASDPRLERPGIEVRILCGLNLPAREIDLVVLYHDTGPADHYLTNSSGVPVHSFVLVIEVKQHSPDLIRFEGPKVEVRYDGVWKDATSQCMAQVFGFKQYQRSTFNGAKRRHETFVQNAIWLARASETAFDGTPSHSRVPVHFAELTWQKIADGLEVNSGFGSIRTLSQSSSDEQYHCLDSLVELLTYKVRPTSVDLRRMNSLTQTRFDAEKTQYIQNLGEGLLVLKGRGGTGKTFSLIQIALHLVRRGKMPLLLTFNHGLIADISRALSLIRAEDRTLNAVPKVQTRYSFIQDVFERNFGTDAEYVIRKDPSSIVAKEQARTERLLGAPTLAPPEFDFVLIDEGQDWDIVHRDLIYKLFGPGRVVVADGIDQFVTGDRCEWDLPNIPINRRHSLRSSKRTKAATCQTVAEVAKALGVSDWDLEPDPNAQGGRFSVFVEPSAPQAVEVAFRELNADLLKNHSIRPVDNLVCLPSTKVSRGVNYSVLFDRKISDAKLDSWRGFDAADRRIYPIRDGQVRAVQYHSCRGMEGWTSVCLGLDTFFDYQMNNPHFDLDEVEEQVRDKRGLFFSESDLDAAVDQAARNYAVNWLMIPLTRSMDHLIIHLTSEQSELAKILRKVSDTQPGAIEWLQA